MLMKRGKPWSMMSLLVTL